MKASFKEFIKKIYKETEWGYWLLRPVILVYEWLILRLYSDEYYIKKRFRKTFGFELNLEDPKTLNAKIQWLKLYDRTDLHTKCADKYAVREFIKEQVGEDYLPVLLFHTKDVKKLIASNLPSDGTRFIIKTNHDSSGGLIVRDINQVDFAKQQLYFRRLLKNNFYWSSKEWQYKNITPRIIVEQLLEDKEGKIPNDYKFHCFHGKPKFIYCSVDREGGNTRHIYDINWEPLPFVWVTKGKNVNSSKGQEIPKPQNYDKMIEIVEKLASHFIYVRIDLYNVDGKIYVGEITFHHGSGFDVFEPIEWDYKYGSMLKLPVKR